MHHTKLPYIIYSILLLTVTIASCSTTSNNEPTVDISNLEDNECAINGDGIYAKVEKIDIETNDSCMMNSPCIYYIDDNCILLGGYDYIKKFDRKGNYICDIGKRGHGYGEYVNMNSVSASAPNNTIFVGTFGNDIYKYSFDGKYMGKFSVSDSGERLMTSQWSEALNMYVCETRHYHPDGLDVYLSTWTADGKKTATYPVYSDNITAECDFTHTGSMRESDKGLLFMLPFCNTVYLLTKDGLSESFVIERGRHTPSRDLVEVSGNSAKLEKECYDIGKWHITPNYIYLTISCQRGYRDIIVRRTDNAIVHNKYYDYKTEASGNCHLHLKKLGSQTSFWPRYTNGNKVACLVEPESRRDMNPTLVIAAEK